jgi:hypothetical protein
VKFKNVSKIEKFPRTKKYSSQLAMWLKTYHRPIDD